MATSNDHMRQDVKAQNSQSQREAITNCSQNEVMIISHYDLRCIHNKIIINFGTCRNFASCVIKTDLGLIHIVNLVKTPGIFHAGFRFASDLLKSYYICIQSNLQVIILLNQNQKPKASRSRRIIAGITNELAYGPVNSENTFIVLHLLFSPG